MQIVRFSTLLRIALPAHHRQAFSRSARSRAHATPPRVRSPAAPGACFAWAANGAASDANPSLGLAGPLCAHLVRPTLPLPSATLSSVVLAAQLISHGQRRRHQTHQEGAPGPRKGPPIHLQRRPTRRRSLPLAVYDHGTGARVCRCGRPPHPYRFAPSPPPSAPHTARLLHRRPPPPPPRPFPAPVPRHLLHLPLPRTCTLALALALVLTHLPLFALIFTHTSRALPRRKTRRTREASSS